MTPNEIISGAVAEGRNFLFEDEAKVLVAAVGLPVVETVAAFSEEEAVRAAERMGYPVVVKVRSAAYLHKSDVGGVRLDLAGPEDVRRAYREITAAARAVDREVAVTVQRMAGRGQEVIVGVSTDPHFGPVLMFGLGGVMTELLDDFTFRMIPVSRRDAREMIRDLRGVRLLDGYRGNPPVNLDVLVDIICRVSDLVEKYPALREMDLNPVAAYPDGALVLDARVVLGEVGGRAVS